MAFLLPLLFRFLPYILGLVAVTSALGYGAWRVEHWCNASCRVEKVRADTATTKLAELDRQRIAQQERWAQATAAEEQRAKVRDEERRVAFLGLVNRARSDRAAAAVLIPHASLGVLAESFAAAEPSPDPVKPSEAPAADTNAAQVITWGVEILEWSAACKARVNSWETYYNSLREQQ